MQRYVGRPLAVGDNKMFKLILSPQANFSLGKLHTEISVDGSVLTYNGAEYDFSGLPVNSQAEAEYPASKVSNVDGLIIVELVYQYNSMKAEPMQSTNLDDYTFLVEAGDVPCPIVWKQEAPAIDLPEYVPPPADEVEPNVQD